MLKKGLLIIIAGPSGAGKSTIRKKVMQMNELNLIFSISHTTRQPRINERNGVDYYFISQDEFIRAIKNKEFLEYAKFIDNYYGTSKKMIDQWRNEGKNVVLEIEIEGTKQILQYFNEDEILSFFIIAPNLDELKKRITNRSTENPKMIEKRLMRAKEEMKFQSYFQHIIINDNVNRAVDEIIVLIKQKIK